MIHCANAVSTRVVKNPRVVSIDTFAYLSFVHNLDLIDDVKDAPFIAHGVSGQ